VLENPPLLTPANEILAILDSWSPVAPAQQRLKGEYESFLRTTGEAALSRTGGPEHLTGSCFILTPDLCRVLLCFHRKGQFWVQLGGHVEPGDASVAAAAYREGREESGVTDIRPFGSMPLDLDRHSLSRGFGTCRVHWDVGYVALADADAVPEVSIESEAVAWFDVTNLPEQVPEGFPARLCSILDELAHRQGSDWAAVQTTVS